MTFNLTTDYAIRIILCLGKKGNVLSASVLATEMEIPEKYLMKVVKKLKDGKLVTSIAGVNGGYCLCKDLNEITLLDVMNIVQAKSKEEQYEEYSNNKNIQDFYKIKNYYKSCKKRLENEYLTKSLAEILM